MEPKVRRNLGEILVKNLTDLRDELRAGTVRQRFTMRSVPFDLRPQPFDADAVRRVRVKLGMSQGVFAAVLGVTVDTVQSWEQGKNKPEGLACRFLDEINRNPDIAINILRRSAEMAGADH